MPDIPNYEIYCDNIQHSGIIIPIRMNTLFETFLKESSCFSNLIMVISICFSFVAQCKKQCHE